MAKEQLAVIEMVTNMILGKTEGISKVDFVPQKTRCPEPENGMHMHDKVPVIQDQDIEKTKNQQQIFPRKTPESQGIVSDHLRYLMRRTEKESGISHIRCAKVSPEWQSVFW